MFAGIRRILGNVKVTETVRSTSTYQINSEITIDGIPADVMMKDISKIWKTSRININMFSKIGKNSVTFPSFFAVDMCYMIDHMIQFGNRNVSSRTLNKIRQELIENTWLITTQQEPQRRVDLSKINNMVFRPKDYQQKFFEDYDKLTQQYRLRGYLLAAAAGSGKTYSSLTLAEILNAKRIVVVCPKNALYRVWESSVQSLYKKPPSYWIYDQGVKYKGQRIAIFHYEALKQALDMVKELSSPDTLVILDECHNLNEETSIRTQNFIQLCQRLEARDVLPMSGTPIKALGGESIPLLTLIDPLFSNDAKMRFKKIYGRDGNRGIDILSHRIGIVSYKVEKSQLGLDKPVMKSLPVKIPNGERYTLKEISKEMKAFIDERFDYYKKRRPEDQRFYDECLSLFEQKIKTPSQRNDFSDYKRFVKFIQRVNGDARQAGEEIKWVNRYEKTQIIPSLTKNMVERFKDVKSVIKYVNLKIQGEALGRILGRKRIDCHVEMVPYIDFKGITETTPKKTVVFTSFVDALEKADSHIRSIGLNPITVYGKTNNEMPNSIRLFEKNEDVNPLCATYASLSTAVPLVMADTMIMIDSPFRAYIHEQAISRIHRLGADTQTTIWECKLDTGNEPNISTRSADILQWSQDQVMAIMGTENPFKIEEDSGKLTVSNEDFDIIHEEFWNIAPSTESFIGTQPYQKIMGW